jgi:hypothetical protein
VPHLSRSAFAACLAHYILMELPAKSRTISVADHTARGNPVPGLRNTNEMSIEIYTKKVYSDTKKNWICSEWM